MSKDKNPGVHKHDASDRALDQSAEAEQSAAATGTGPTHDPSETRKHNDPGKDRLFEGRQQHDEAEKNSEKTRLARDIQEHHHDTDPDTADAGSGQSAKRKS